MAQEVNTHDRDDVFSGTPPLKAHRMVVSSAATSQKGEVESQEASGKVRRLRRVLPRGGYRQNRRGATEGLGPVSAVVFC